jgi:pSer/pThr/pTyr-binding forkhead associated (FHA) protein
MVVKTQPVTERETAEREIPKSPFNAPHVMVLAEVQGSDPSRVHRIVQPETILGRGETADIEIEDDEVSKHHCVVRVTGAVFSVVDLGSLNGTSVNFRNLRPRVAQRLRNLDVIRIGETRLLFLSGRFKDRATGS